MSNAASQATAFYREVAQTRKVWTVRDAGGFPAPKNSRGVRAQPFWSSFPRVQRIVKNVRAYRGFDPVEITWEEFRDEWLQRLLRDGMEVGVNWAGRDAKGYDLSPSAVREAVEYQIQHLAASAK
jgi:Protein of unknown function (DUF2750)